VVELIGARALLNCGPGSAIVGRLCRPVAGILKIKIYSFNIAKTGLLLSRGHERTWPLPGPRGSNLAWLRCWFFFKWVKSVEEGAGGGGSACVTGWPDQRTAYSSP
jgi:hypothetical protein